MLCATSGRGLRLLWSRSLLGQHAGAACQASLSTAAASTGKASTSTPTGTSVVDGGSDDGEAIAVDPPLQDLFVRLSKDHAATASTRAAKAKPAALSAEALTAARPHAASGRSARAEPPDWSPEYFVSIAHDLGHLRHYHRIWHKMASALVQFPDRFLYRMTPKMLTELAVGYAQVKVQEPQLFREIAHHARRCIRAFSPAQLAQITWALSEVRYPGMHSSLEAFARQAEAVAAEFEPKDAVTLMAALAALNELELPSVARFLPVLSGRLAKLKTPLLLSALSATGTALAKTSRAGVAGTHAELRAVGGLLLEARPLLVGRAGAAEAAWREQLAKAGGRGEGGGSDAALAAHGEWHEWARARELFGAHGSKGDADAVMRALAPLGEVAAQVKAWKGGEGDAAGGGACAAPA
ncbi:hypothetical protein FOA52_009055 [Chlamydomonas sp. UWO 241]|nr:hypothetical protein FOA52_009055 [Chlamydomonas sp. UWO 241]